MTVKVVDEVFAARRLLVTLASRQWASRLTLGLVVPHVLLRRGRGRPVVLALPLRRSDAAVARYAVDSAALNWLLDAGMVEVGPWAGAPFERASVTVTRAGLRAWRSGRMVIAITS